MQVWPHRLEKAPDVASVAAVVLMPKNSRNRAEAIAPVRMTESVTNYGNLFGATWQGAGAMAVFPISEFKTRHSRGRAVTATRSSGFGRAKDGPVV